MRMWMLDPRLLCRKHLLGEHNELHMLAGSLARGIRLDGFAAKGLLEPRAMLERHDSLAREMLRRGYAHRSLLPDCTAALAGYPAAVREGRVDREASARELASRCEECARRMVGEEGASDFSIP